MVGKKYTKMFMRFYFFSNLIVHKERWMFRFIKFKSDKKRLCFLGIKRGHILFKIQIEKFSSVSRFAIINNTVIYGAYNIYYAQ